MYLKINNICLPPTLIEQVKRCWDRITSRCSKTLWEAPTGSNTPPSVLQAGSRWLMALPPSKREAKKGTDFSIYRKNNKDLTSFIYDVGPALMINKPSLIAPLPSAFRSRYHPAFPERLSVPMGFRRAPRRSHASDDFSSPCTAA